MKKKEPVPPKKRIMIFKKGEFVHLSASKGFTKAQFKVYFKDDPEGCYGFGMTEQEAKENLLYYVGLQDL
jgi:hypothetical protein